MAVIGRQNPGLLIRFLKRETCEMDKLLSTLLFAAALILGLSTTPSMTHACPMQSAQAEDSSPVQLAMEDSDEGSDEGSDDEEGDDGEGE